MLSGELTFTASRDDTTVTILATTLEVADGVDLDATASNEGSIYGVRLVLTDGRLLPLTLDLVAIVERVAAVLRDVPHRAAPVTRTIADTGDASGNLLGGDLSGLLALADGETATFTVAVTGTETHSVA